jgi:hypothetical protein
MVTSWVRNHTPLTLRPISDHVETDLCSKKIVYVDGFLHLTRVAKGFSISVLHRPITWISCWSVWRGDRTTTEARGCLETSRAPRNRTNHPKAPDPTTCISGKRTVRITPLWSPTYVDRRMSFFCSQVRQAIQTKRPRSRPCLPTWQHCAFVSSVADVETWHRQLVSLDIPW